MSGDPTKAHIWTDADIYIGATDADNPANVDAAFGADWDLIGLLDGDDGFTETRNEDTTDHFAWGGIIVRTSRRHFKLQKKFTALEDNVTTRQLIWPGSSGGELIVPKPARIKIAFETTEGDTVHRLISAYQAEVTVDGDLNENESDLAKYALIATIFPDADGVLFIEQPADEAGS